MIVAYMYHPFSTTIHLYLTRHPLTEYVNNDRESLGETYNLTSHVVSLSSIV